jgi:solute carrier family 25 (mitochondrial S-adenosylmethionine transporter), member 26
VNCTSCHGFKYFSPIILMGRLQSSLNSINEEINEIFDPIVTRVECVKQLTLLVSTVTPFLSYNIRKVIADDSSQSAPKKELSIKESTVSGFYAGAAITCAKTFIKYPLDSVTVRRQVPYAVDHRAEKESIHSLDRQSLEKLFAGCYRGVAGPLLVNVPAGAVFFAAKDATKATLSKVGIDMSIATCVAVSVALLPYWLVRNPSEVVKTRQQASLEGYGDGVSLLDAYNRVRSDSGCEAFYTGYWENIFYSLPADIIKFLVYDSLSNGRSGLQPFEGAVYGALSTVVAQLATTPLDVVRNRVMTDVSSSLSINDSNESTASSQYLERLLQVAKDEGLAGLFAGTTPRIAKAILSGAIQFATYEETKRQFLNWISQL